VQSELVAQYIRAKAKETGLPVWAFAEDVAASGGYWLMCAADKGRLFACKTSVVGSIGVISQSFGVVDVLKRVGVESRRYNPPLPPPSSADPPCFPRLRRGVSSARPARAQSRAGRTDYQKLLLLPTYVLVRSCS
jgi:hypothetical protein